MTYIPQSSQCMLFLYAKVITLKIVVPFPFSVDLSGYCPSLYTVVSLSDLLTVAKKRNEGLTRQT